MTHGFDFTDDELDVAYVTKDAIKQYMIDKLQKKLGRTYDVDVLQHRSFQTPTDLTIEILFYAGDEDYEALQELMDKEGVDNEEQLFSSFLSEEYDDIYTFKFFVNGYDGCYIIRHMQ